MFSSEDFILTKQALLVATKQIAEYKQRAEAAEAKLRELEMQEPVGYVRPSFQVLLHEYKEAELYAEQGGDDEIPLYAKPFPKQEDK